MVLVSGTFDPLTLRHVRFLQAAARIGSVHVLLLERPVRQTPAVSNNSRAEFPQFPVAERRYILEAIRFVQRVTLLDPDADEKQLVREVRRLLGGQATNSSGVWVWPEWEHRSWRESACLQNQIPFQVIPASSFPGLSEDHAYDEDRADRVRKRVIVTGCYDYLHSGHVRFFEDASQLGDLYVVVGSDRNVRLLKGEGHPMFPQEERRYLVAAVRHVKAALISSGTGWMDAEPEIGSIQPHIYAVNEDGDRPEKRQFCESNGLEYVVLQREPAPGLPRRSSTDLRGF